MLANASWAGFHIQDMTSSEPIICRSTPWFRYRAALIFLMFGVFAALFYIDGSSGYRKKNKAFYLHQCFKDASELFSQKNADQKLGVETWREFASNQKVAFPKDRSILPKDMVLPMPWPEILANHERMKSLQWNQLWLDYTEAEGLDSTPPEKVYDARSIREQWLFFCICLVLAILSLFILIRTSRRKLVAEHDALISHNGRRIPYSEFIRLDLRKWDSKGIAYAEFQGSSGKGKLRIDGLTYGGFKKEDGELAEKLMQRLRSKFSGELLEYTSLSDPDTERT